MTQSSMKIIAAILFVLGALSLIAAILYFALPAHSLPGFMPGHVVRVTGHRNRRGFAALVVAIVFFGIGAWATSAAKHAPA